MQITELARDVSIRFAEQKDIKKRLEFAEEIARKYKFSPKELVLFYTHPIFSKLPFAKRCEKLGLTEEELAFYAMQPGVKKFLQDYQELTATSLKTQSYEKIAEGIEKDRKKWDKNGNEIEDYSLEMEIYKSSIPREPPAQASAVNIQFNMWERARQKAIEIEKED